MSFLRHCQPGVNECRWKHRAGALVWCSVVEWRTSTYINSCDLILITSSCGRQSRGYNLYFTGKDISAQRIKWPTQGRPASQWGCGADLDPRFSDSEHHASTPLGSWYRAKGPQRAETSADDQCEILTLSRKGTALLLFFNYLKPSRGKGERKPRLMTRRQSSRGQTAALFLPQQGQGCLSLAMTLMQSVFVEEAIKQSPVNRSTFIWFPKERQNLNKEREKVLKMNQMFSFHNPLKTCRFNNTQVPMEHLVLPVIYTPLKSSPNLFKPAKYSLCPLIGNLPADYWFPSSPNWDQPLPPAGRLSFSLCY